MVNFIKIVITLMLIIQLISTYIYFKPHFEDWVTDDSKQKWINKRDRIIILLSVFYLTFSFLTLKNILTVNIYMSYVFIRLIIAMTIIILLFHWSKFEIFEKNKKKQNEKNNILIESEFLLKKLSEEDLKAKIIEFYSEYFSNDFNDLKKKFIDKNFDEKKLNSLFKVRKSKKFGYEKIFELMNDLTEYGILDLFRNNRKSLNKFIIKNFEMGGESINDKNLTKALSIWLSKIDRVIC